MKKKPPTSGIEKKENIRIEYGTTQQQQQNELFPNIIYSVSIEHDDGSHLYLLEDRMSSTRRKRKTNKAHKS